MMRFFLSSLLCISLNIPALSQVEKTGIPNPQTEKVWRINFINPGIEVELPATKTTTFSINPGIGYDGSYRNLAGSSSGWIYVIAPFLDLQYKWFYNLENRLANGRNITHNSGNFVGMRMLSHGPSIADNVYRYADYDFVFSPVWGIQRNYGSFHMLFDVGPVYYTDIKGNNGFFIITFEVNLGLDF